MGEENYVLSFTGSSDYIILKETICFNKNVKAGWFNKKYLVSHKGTFTYYHTDGPGGVLLKNK